MPFTFVHTADWQIGKTFGRFANDVGVQLRAARLDAVDRIAEIARDAGARHVLVAGDVIDSELIDDAGLRQPFGRMSLHRDLRWHLLPGNHDPARPGGIWERVAGFGAPENVTLHLHAAVAEIEPGVALLPAPLAAKAMGSDPTAWMDTAETPAGVLRIALAHGSVRGFGSLGEAAVPIVANRRQSAGLDYLALGDWHGVKEVASGVWYSGTPEPDSFADNDPGHVLVVGLDGLGAAPRVKPVASASCRWIERRIVLSRVADLDPVGDELAALAGDRRRLLLELVLEGALGGSEAARLEGRLEAFASIVLALQIDRRRLRVTFTGDDVASIADPALSAVATRLVSRAREDGETGEGRIAGRALRLLLAMGAPGSPTEPPL